MWLSEQIPFGDTSLQMSFGEAFLRQPEDLYREGKIACVSTYHNWRERLQKCVCKYPFQGNVRIYEETNIFIFLVFKESVLKENLLAQKIELCAHNGT